MRCAAAADESASTLSGTPAFVAESRRPVTVKAAVTVLLTVGGLFAHMDVTRGLDDINDLLGRTLHLELVSADLDHGD